MKSSYSSGVPNQARQVTTRAGQLFELHIWLKARLLERTAAQDRGSGYPLCFGTTLKIYQVDVLACVKFKVRPC
ncbi:hypothetical protein [uncultured Campylobacter sp.]|uniref:hypothetical protein n=1 Tax=uncultured Campylobacter sp. TaxID=218934 RepID=UPI00261CB682|nr:hypothetical protein [uncultured Campylobacter sp.]